MCSEGLSHTPLAWTAVCGRLWVGSRLALGYGCAGALCMEHRGVLSTVLQPCSLQCELGWGCTCCQLCQLCCQLCQSSAVGAPLAVSLWDGITCPQRGPCQGTGYWELSAFPTPGHGDPILALRGVPRCAGPGLLEGVPAGLSLRCSPHLAGVAEGNYLVRGIKSKSEQRPGAGFAHHEQAQLLLRALGRWITAGCFRSGKF